MTVLGGGHGVAAALEALRDDGHDLTAVVTIADDGGSSGELRRRGGGAAVGDLRRALIALSTDAELAARLADRVSCGSLGCHPVGNLLIRSLTDTLSGDLQAAVDSLGTQLQVRGRVIGATIGEVSLIGVAQGELLFGESAIGSAKTPIDKLRFSPARPQVSPAAIDAVLRADVVLLGPGSLFTSVLAVAALPEMNVALATTPAQVVWICNLAREPGETRSLSGGEHLSALRHAGVRVDAVLHDPGAPLHLTAEEIARAAVPVCEGRLAAAVQLSAHDPARLRSALRDVVKAVGEAGPVASSGRQPEAALA
ncbi:MAG TPA: uridine diphosphate-N-acetylglucosamine-binding protein YvcK [Solirubrobacteraceae bacterium]